MIEGGEQKVVVADIGGTHARFAIARVMNGQVRGLERMAVLRTREHTSFEAAWSEYGTRCAGRLPAELAIAFAGPVQPGLLRLTNSDWAISPDELQVRLGLSHLTVLNDFGAVAHAVANLPTSEFVTVGGPDDPLPADGVISIVGPGTGLGVAALLRRGERYEVIETEGGHLGFAPLDETEDRILARLRTRFGRVSVERIVAGQALPHLYQALAAIGEKEARQLDEASLWGLALAGGDPLAAAALEQLLRCLGSVAGDLALAHGASAVVIAGGIGRRLGERLATPGFRDRFVAKGRFRGRLERTPVKLITCPEPGLFGAAAAHARQA